MVWSQIIFYSDLQTKLTYYNTACHTEFVCKTNSRSNLLLVQKREHDVFFHRYEYIFSTLNNICLISSGLLHLILILTNGMLKRTKRRQSTNQTIGEEGQPINFGCLNNNFSSHKITKFFSTFKNISDFVFHINLSGHTCNLEC